MSATTGTATATKASENKTAPLKDKDIWGEDEASALDQQIAGMDTQQLQSRTKMLENNIRIMKSDLTRMGHEVKAMEAKIKENAEKIKMNKQLPYLVSNVVEILDLKAEDEDDGGSVDLNSQATKCVVIKTSTRQTVFLPVVGLVDPKKLKPGDLVGVNKDSFLILDTLPTEYDSRVKAMELDEKPTEDYNDIGGLDKQIQELIEAVVRPMTHKHLFDSIGIKPPKGVLMYGPPGTGKTLLARAVAHHTDCCFIRVSGSELVQKYIGEGSRMVRELFVMARQHAPSIIFMDEIDSIGGTRIDSSRGGDSEVQRTMLELLNQLDGFEPSQNIKVLMATNRIDILDPALLRPGRIDRKIEFPHPNEAARLQILKIHSRKMNLMRGINLKKIAAMMKDASGAEMKGVCTEAGMFALRERRIHVTQEDFEMSVSKVLKKDSEKDMSAMQFWK